MNNFLNNPNYILVGLVGNKYCEKKPSSKDTKLRFKYERHNIHDANAIKVMSVRNNDISPIGYIDRCKNKYLKSLIKEKRVKYKTIVQKLYNGDISYYIIFKLINKL